MKFRKLLYRYSFALLGFLLFFVFSVNFCLAADLPQQGILPDSEDKIKYAKGDYTLNDFVQLAINVSNWILGIVGSLALLMFVYGGVIFLISSGNKEMVEKAKKIIFGAVIGLAIVFTSYLIIKFTYQIMGLDWKGDTNLAKPITMKINIKNNKI